MANNKILILEQNRPTKQTFLLSGPTQIGRAHNLEWAVVSRKMPEQFKHLETFISIGGTESVSRNHAAIYRDTDGNFYVLDGNSKNGTYVNRQNINPTKSNPVPRQLAQDDVISFGGALELRVAGFTSPQTNNRCLLVGSDGGTLSGVKNDMDYIATQLSQRGFEGNITKLYNGNATKPQVINELVQAAYLTTPESHYVFFFSGHGTKERGLALGNQEFLSPKKFYEKLANIRGKKAVILDCCHAGIFLDSRYIDQIPSDTLVLAASSAEGRAGEKPDWTIVGGAYMGEFTAALVKYLDSHKGRLDLRDFKQELDRTFATANNVCIHYQKPQIDGRSFTVLTARTL